MQPLQQHSSGEADVYHKRLLELLFLFPSRNHIGVSILPDFVQEKKIAADFFDSTHFGQLLGNL